MHGLLSTVLRRKARPAQPLVGVCIAGVQKAGTTALYRYLAKHPQIQFGSKKELHFFDNESLDWENPSYEELHGAFGEAKPGAVLCDATPIYVFWPTAMARIAAYNPRMKLIVMFRDPADRAFSHWRMLSQRYSEKLSFSEAIRSGRNRLAGKDPASRAYRGGGAYVARGFYYDQMMRVIEHFPEDQILLLRQQDLKVDHESVLDRVTDFIGVDRFETYPRKRTVFSLAGQDDRMSDEDRAYLDEIFADQKRKLLDRFGIDLGAAF